MPPGPAGCHVRRTGPYLQHSRMRWAPWIAPGGAAPDCRAGPEWHGDITVDELVVRALVDNPDVQATQAEVDAAHGRLQQAGLRPNPSLDLGVQQNVAGPDNNITASVTVPLDLNGKSRARRRGGARAGDEACPGSRTSASAPGEVRLKAGEFLAASGTCGLRRSCCR